jgi:hypothetical protein
MPGGLRMAYEVPVGSEHRTMILKTVLERPCAEQNSRGKMVVASLDAQRRVVARASSRRE